MIQYLDYLGEVAARRFRHLDRHQAPGLDEFFTLFPATLELSLCAILFAIILGIPAGIFAAVKRGTWFDQTLMGTALDRLFDADLLVGPAAHHLFSGMLGWTPVSGRIGLMYFFKPVTGFMLIDS